MFLFPPTPSCKDFPLSQYNLLHTTKMKSIKLPAEMHVLYRSLFCLSVLDFVCMLLLFLRLTYAAQDGTQTLGFSNHPGLGFLDAACHCAQLLHVIFNEHVSTFKHGGKH